MPRAKRGFKRRRRANKVLDRAEGYVLGLSSIYSHAAEAVDRAHVYAYRDRRRKKRFFRQLWIARLSAATATFDMSYSRFIGALKKSNVELDRKILADIALTDPACFGSICDKVRAQAPKN